MRDGCIDVPRRRSPEQQIQKAVLQHLALRGLREALYFHSANGGFRTPAEGAIFAGMGVVPGTPDVFVIHRGTTYALKLKAATGRLTPAQSLCHERLRQAGAHVATAQVTDQALERLAEWKLLPAR